MDAVKLTSFIDYFSSKAIENSSGYETYCLQQLPACRQFVSTYMKALKRLSSQPEAWNRKDTPEAKFLAELTRRLDLAKSGNMTEKFYRLSFLTEFIDYCISGGWR
jgi:hypothetical protein